MYVNQRWYVTSQDENDFIRLLLILSLFILLVLLMLALVILHSSSCSKKSCSLTLARTSALSCFLIVNLLLTKLVSAPTPFSPMPASQIYSLPSPEGFKKSRRLSGWLAAAGRA
jgi:hypothetical protein